MKTVLCELSQQAKDKLTTVIAAVEFNVDRYNSIVKLKIFNVWEDDNVFQFGIRLVEKQNEVKTCSNIPLDQTKTNNNIHRLRPFFHELLPLA